MESSVVVVDLVGHTQLVVSVIYCGLSSPFFLYVFFFFILYFFIIFSFFRPLLFIAPLIHCKWVIHTKMCLFCISVLTLANP